MGLIAEKVQDVAQRAGISFVELSIPAFGTGDSGKLFVLDVKKFRESAAGSGKLVGSY